MSEILLFLGTEEDKGYAPQLKPLVSAATVFTVWQPVSTLAEIVLYCRKRNITGVISTQIPILLKLLTAAGNHKKSASLDDYQGSYFNHQGIEFVFINPLKQLLTVSYGKFIARRFISKLSAPSNWYEVPEFNWEIINANNSDRIFNQYTSAVAIAVDIETLKENLVIRCIGYTAIFIDALGNFTTHSSVLPIDSHPGDGEGG